MPPVNNRSPLAATVCNPSPFPAFCRHFSPKVNTSAPDTSTESGCARLGRPRRENIGKTSVARDVGGKKHRKLTSAYIGPQMVRSKARHLCVASIHQTFSSRKHLQKRRSVHWQNTQMWSLYVPIQKTKYRWRPFNWWVLSCRRTWRSKTGDQAAHVQRTPGRCK